MGELGTIHAEDVMCVCGGGGVCVCVCVCVCVWWCAYLFVLDAQAPLCLKLAHFFLQVLCGIFSVLKL